MDVFPEEGKQASCHQVFCLKSGLALMVTPPNRSVLGIEQTFLSYPPAQDVSTHSILTTVIPLMCGTKQVRIQSDRDPYDNCTGPRTNLHPKRVLESILGSLPGRLPSSSYPQISPCQQLGLHSRLKIVDYLACQLF